MITLITTEREHLFDLSRRMMLAIDPGLMQDPAKPLVISVRGSMTAGKKIFPDAARDALLDQQLSFKGKMDSDEIWAANGIEMSFVNMVYDNEHSPLLKNITEARTSGGIVYIHNSEEIAAQADIDICLEQYDRSPMSYCGMHIKKGAPRNLRNTFNKLSETTPWTRYVEINVGNPKLAESPQFREFLQSLEPKPSSTLHRIFNLLHLPGPPKFLQREVPLYGQNILRTEM
jgi:hypothetical protein